MSQVHQHIRQPNRQQTTLHQCVVPAGDRRHHQTPQARPTEDRLRHNRPGKQRAKLQTDYGHNRHQRIRQCVAVDDRIFRESFGARCANVIAVQLFQHRRPHHAG